MRKILLSYLVIFGLLCASAVNAEEQSSDSVDDQAIFEIRNYHYDPAQFDAYKVWLLEEAAPFLRENLNVVGFWVGNAQAPEINGASPMELSLGSANVTWIIRWGSMQERAKTNEQLFAGEQWQKIWAKHPDPNGYLQVESRFAKGY
ncbi:hypothetical protein QWI17_17350 [Gilvimarinus sp. SDUM040013]|uniref:NIPSNAP domain-containing protein n=1 Tax=Gilvimarinus gilvus TaxID=3058038 RepID=A0ABU4RYZ2_9GAMM|nr:hypothetical protein [Gilvimarinus sp. SDUM040013]MDO3387613.1 hypothetical protein [Gilvimarinus sp. SDUM040013]MDX6850122.1 hypothetical protein [Gilvimarinus sp. SDUM040013]